MWWVPWRQVRIVSRCLDNYLKKEKLVLICHLEQIDSFGIPCIRNAFICDWESDMLPEDLSGSDQGIKVLFMFPLSLKYSHLIHLTYSF